MKIFKTILFLAVMIISANSFGQTDCYNAVYLQDEASETVYTNENYFWCSSNSYSDSMIFVFSTNNSQNALINTIVVYKGDCDNLEMINATDLVNPDSLYYLEIFDYDPGSNYFFQIFFSNILEGDFTINSIIVPPGAPCPPSLSCSLVRNFSFEDYYQNIVPSDAFQSGHVCHWQRAWGTPGYSGFGFPNTDGAYMWASMQTYYPNSHIMEAIYQDGMTLQPNIEYEISYDYYSNSDEIIINVGLTNYQLPAIVSGSAADPIPSGFTMLPIGNHNLSGTSVNVWHNYPKTSFSVSSSYDNLVIYPYSPSPWVLPNYAIPYIIIDNIVIKPKLIFQNLQSPQTISCGSSVYMQPTVPTANIVSWQWTSNQTSGVISNSQNFQVSPPVTTTYTVVATDANQCTWTGEFVVNVVPLQTLPLTINLNWGKTCSEYANFTFTMPSSPVIDHTTWFVPNNAVITTTNALNDITVNWNNAGIATITVQGFSANGCLIYEGSLLVNPNQNPSAATYYINNLNATQIKQMFGIIAPNLSITNIQDIINIDGRIVINENLTFASCTNVILGLNAKIIVMPGCTLSIASSHFSASECKWDGIFVENPTARLIVQNSFISGAKNAVVSGYDGKIYLYNTIFSDNLLGVWVRKYNPELIPDQNGGWILPPAHNAYIGKCRFELSTNNTELLLGIKADTVYNLTIGDVNTANNTNEFYKLRTSIISNSSDVNIYNNYFNTNFYSNEPNPYYFSAEPWDAAIFIKRPYDPNPPQVNYYAIQNIVNIGGSAINQPNTFYQQNVGVYGFSTQVHVRNNSFTNQRFSAVHLKDLYNSDINYNSITMQNNLWATNNLYNSTILTENSVATARVRLNINNNTINNSRTAINSRNCNGDNGYYFTNIKINTVNFNTVTPTTTNRYFGISASNCSYAAIESNNMSYGSNPPSTFHEGLYGIYLSTTTNAKVSHNRSGGMGDGIYIAGSSLGSQYFCNDLDKCWYGFYFNSSVLSHQLLNPIGNNTTSDNYWYDIPPVTITTALRRMEGTMASGNQINWRHQALTNDINNIYSPYINYTDLLYGIIFPIQNQPANTNCYAWFVMNPIGREALLGDIVRDSINYQVLPEENEYLGKEFAFKELDKDPASLSLYVPEDSLYQNFYTTTKLSNIGKNDEVNKAINNHDYLTALNLNATISPQNTIEANRKTVHGIYLEKLVNNIKLPANDSLTLLAIAMQTPLIGGDAVYSARVILGIDPLQYNLDYAKPPVHPKLTDNKAKVKIYPNPASDQLSIELSNTMEGIANIGIYDLNGKLCYQTIINTAQQLQTVDIGSIKKGIYNIRIIANNLSEYQKLVIIK